MNHFNVMLMFSNPYEIKDEETKEIKRGVSVEYYFFGQNGEQLVPAADASGSLGIRRSKASLDISMKNKLMFVPGIYDGQFEMAVGSDGKPMLKLVDIDYIGKVSMHLEPETPFDTTTEEELKAESDAATQEELKTDSGKAKK